MKKSKFIINKVGKLSTLIPALALTVTLKGYGLGLHKQVSQYSNEVAQSISIEQETLDYETESTKYSEKDALNNLLNILNSDLFKLENNNFPEEQVQAEINKFIKAMKSNTLKLACLYRALETYTIEKASSSSGDFIQKSDKLATRIDTQHYLHNMLDNLNLIRIGINKDEYKKIYESKKNEDCSFLLCNTTNEQDLRKDSASLLNSFKNNIPSFIYFGNENEKQLENYLIVSFVENDFQEIDFLVSKPDFNQKDCNNLLNVIYSIAETLPDMFGTESMIRGLIIEYTTQYAFNNLLDHLEKVNYQVNSFTNQTFIKDSTTLTK